MAPKNSQRLSTPGSFLRRPAFAIVVAAFVFCLAALLTACGNDEGNNGRPAGPTVTRPAPEGETRGIRLGFSTLPPERTSQSAVSTFATIAQYGDVAMIQRPPPWTDFLPGGQVSALTNETTRFETALLDQYKGLKRFYAIDPTDGVVQRARIANLPASVDPQGGFADPNLRSAFLSYTAYVVKNYRPDYLALGVEINMLYERSPKQFEAFVSLYKLAYDIAKQTSPKTKVFPTFQLEDLEGTFGDIHPPHWEVLEPFRGKMDALAVSTYPFLAELRGAADLRPDYYSQLKQHFSGEILVSEAGYASAPVEGKVNVGTEEDQQAFLTRLLGDAEGNGFSMVVWFAARDPAFATEGAASVFKDIGLRRSDGSNKAAWSTWEEWARRPLQ